MKVISNIYRARRLVGTIVWDDEPDVQFPPFNARVDNYDDLEMKTLELIAIHRVQ